MPFTSVSSAVQTIQTLDYGMGTVTFSLLMFMLNTDSFDVDMHPRTWVRSMIYLDALAFFVFYLSDVIQDVASCTLYLKLQLASDILWSLKDALKFGYLMYRGLAIIGSKRTWPIYWTAMASLVLYSIYNYDRYSTVLCSCEPSQLAPDDTALDAQTEPWKTLIALYLFWSFVEVGVSVAIVTKMAVSARKVKAMNFAYESYARFKRREENRLLVACLGMGAVTFMTIVHYVGFAQDGGRDGWRVKMDVQVNRIVFVMMQGMMLLGSASGQFHNSGSESEIESDHEDEDEEVKSRLNR
ncbi:hypothetical protein BC830DRAFT_1149978 [Chytriomyces sp. MP71]|nr:hypothetical protein BC830DRAFT_1149978 [Chytriomyces sp. MP71]